MEAIAQQTISCSIRLKCIRKGITLSRSIETGTLKALQKLIQERNALPAITSSTLVCLGSTSPEMHWTNHYEVETSQRLSINRDDAVIRFTPTFTTSETLCDKSL